MRLMQTSGSHQHFPNGHMDVSVFSAVPCVLPAPDALRAFPRRTFPSVSPTPFARRGRFFSSASINTAASTHPSSAPSGHLLPGGEKGFSPSEIF